MDFGLSMPLKIKSYGVIGLAIYGFLLMVNSNIGLARLVQSMNDLDFDLSRSLKVNSNGTVGLPIYGFLFMVNSNSV